MKMKKVTVGIIFGGASAEHKVSIMSALSIIENFDHSKYDIIPVYVDISGNWNLIRLAKFNRANSISLGIKRSIRYFNNRARIKKIYNRINCHKIKKLIDIALPIIHGKIGEDGIIQGFFETLDIPYVSSNILSSSVGMDKDFAKMVLRQKGMLVVPYIRIREYEYLNGATKKTLLEKIRNNLTFPIFVKPANYGSSIGVERVENPIQLEGAIKNALQYGNKVLVEQGIDASEIEVSVLENIHDYDNPIVSYPGKVIPNDKFYSYQAKYLMKNGATFELPAILEQNLLEEIRDQAKKIFKELECHCIARVDFFLEKQTNRLFFNEINTVPGFTNISLYPKLLENIGMSLSDLIENLLELAVKKHKYYKNKNIHSINLLGLC